MIPVQKLGTTKADGQCIFAGAYSPSQMYTCELLKQELEERPAAFYKQSGDSAALQLHGILHIGQWPSRRRAIDQMFSLLEFKSRSCVLIGFSLHAAVQ